MTPMEPSLLSKIKASGLQIGDWIGGWQADAIGPIEAFELRGKMLFCVVAGKQYPVAEIYFCRSPEDYEAIVSEFRKMKQDHGEPRSARETPDEREKRLELEKMKRERKKAMGRAKSGRQF